MPRNSSTSTRAVERALGLLTSVSEHGSLSLADCVRITQLPMTTALRHLRTLENSGFLTRDASGAYSPGIRLTQIGANALSRHSLVRVAVPYMQRLVDETGESTYLAMQVSAESAVYVAMAEGTYSVRHTSWVGRQVPLRGLAIGKAFSGDVPTTGYVYEKDAFEKGVTAIVAPIYAPSGVVGTLSLLGPTYRISDETVIAYGRYLAAAAHRVEEYFLASDPPTLVSEGR